MSADLGPGLSHESPASLSNGYSSSVGDDTESVAQIQTPPVQKRKGGRKPIYATAEERKQRNRQAQAAFRVRRTDYIKQLEGTLRETQEQLERAQQGQRHTSDECNALRSKISQLEHFLCNKGLNFPADLARESADTDPGENFASMDTLEQIEHVPEGRPFRQVFQDRQVAGMQTKASFRDGRTHQQIHTNFTSSQPPAQTTQWHYPSPSSLAVDSPSIESQQQPHAPSQDSFPYEHRQMAGIPNHYDHQYHFGDCSRMSLPCTPLTPDFVDPVSQSYQPSASGHKPSTMPNHRYHRSVGGPEVPRSFNSSVQENQLPAYMSRKRDQAREGALSSWQGVTHQHHPQRAMEQQSSFYRQPTRHALSAMEHEIYDNDRVPVPGVQ